MKSFKESIEEVYKSKMRPIHGDSINFEKDGKNVTAVVLKTKDNIATVHHPAHGKFDVDLDKTKHKIFTEENTVDEAVVNFPNKKRDAPMDLKHAGLQAWALKYVGVDGDKISYQHNGATIHHKNGSSTFILGGHKPVFSYDDKGKPEWHQDVGAAQAAHVMPTKSPNKGNIVKMKEEALDEQSTAAPSLTRHTVVVHVTDPDSPEEGKQKKAISVLASHAASAEKTGRKHFEKKGWTVHSAEVKKQVPVKESDAEWEKSMEKQKHDRINDKDKDTLGKLAALMAKEKKNRPIKEAAENKAAAEVHQNLVYGSVKHGAQDVPHHIKAVMKAHGATDYKKVVDLVRKKGYAGKIDEEVEIEESRGHSIVANKLAQMANRSSEQGKSPAQIRAEKEKEEKQKQTKLGESMLTYAQFIEKLQEGKIDDLRDKQAADREARKNEYDFSKEKDTKKSNVTTVKARSYGSTDDKEEPEEKPAAETTPTEKRGRGRPAGVTGASYKPRSAEIAAAAKAKAAATKAANKNK